MMMFCWSVLVFTVPLGLGAIAIALLGFLWRAAFAPMLVVGALAILWLCRAFATGGGFAPLFVLPLMVAGALSLAGCLLLRATLEAGFRKEAACRDESGRA